jgi:hypothetical protein
MRLFLFGQAVFRKKIGKAEGTVFPERAFEPGAYGISGIDSFGRLCPNVGTMRYVLIISLSLGFLSSHMASAQTNTNRITREMVIQAQKIIGLNFSDAKIDLLLPDLEEQLDRYQQQRKFILPNSAPSAMLFNPIPVGFKFETVRKKFKLGLVGKVTLPVNPDDLAYYSIEQLGALIKSRQITSEKLTVYYLDRLKKYGPKLECVMTLTEDLALAQARQADTEIAAGKYRGPLHGIPYGVKDLIATRKYPTTYGSVPFKDQVLD